MRSRVRHLDHRCSRCGYVQPASLPRCRKCGAGPGPRGSDQVEALGAWALAPVSGGTAGAVATVVLLALMLWVGVPSALRSPVTASQEAPSWLYQIVQMANLVFHEAGHWIFAPLGRFASVLGGSLLEVLIPVVCAVAFVRQGDRRGASFGVWWTGQALAGVAVYIADARAGRLVLLGGRTGSDSPHVHDWRNLLDWTGLLAWDHALAWTAHAAATVLMALGIAWCAGLLLTSRDRDGATATD